MTTNVIILSIMFGIFLSHHVWYFLERSVPVGSEYTTIVIGDIYRR